MKLEHRFHASLYLGLVSFICIAVSAINMGEAVTHSPLLYLLNTMLVVLFGYILIATTIESYKLYIKLNDVSLGAKK